VPELDYVTINASLEQRGVGGSFQGMLGILPRYKLKVLKRYRFSFLISEKII
jgi:hypothetical protein